ncbi:MAG TPA: ABC transporter permease [Bryobacteraceae bacterium]
MFWRRRRQREEELERELLSDLESEAAEQEANGLSPEQARYAARRAFGNTTFVKEDMRRMWISTFWDALLQDARFGARLLRKNLSFSVVAIVSLAVGIGANTSIFSLMDAILLKMAPVDKPQELVILGTQSPEGINHNFYYETYRRLQQEQPFFQSLAAFSLVRLNVRVDGELEPSVQGQLVSGNYFSTLGAGAALGRALTPDDDRIAGERAVAMISYAYWERRFGRGNSVIGEKITISGTPFTIVGVTSPGFFGMEVGSSPDILVPLTMQPEVMPDKENWLRRPRNTVDWLRIAGRLKPGVSREQAASGMRVIYRRIQEQLAGEIDPQWQQTWLKGWAEAGLALEPGATGVSDLRRQLTAPLAIVTVLVGLVLLVACANVSTLLLARATVRRREMAVRVAVGAGRMRLIRQLLIESLMLSILGGMLGTGFAFWGSRALVYFLSTGRTPITLDLNPDLRVFAFAALVSVLTGILFGLVPALRVSQLEINPAPKTLQYRWGKLLIVSQMAVSLILVFGSCLFVGTLQKLNDRDSGFRRDQVLTVRLEPEGSDQKRGVTAFRLNRLYRNVQERIQAIPGVVAASLAGSNPTTAQQNRTYTAFGGREFRAAMAYVYPKYFTTLGTQILQGRDFGPGDMADGAAKVIVISEALAREVFAGENPVGKRIYCAGQQLCEVIGVAGDVPYSHLREEANSVVYYPFLQAPTGRGQMVLCVRFSRSSRSVAAAVRREISAIDPHLPAFEIRTLAAEVDAVLIRERVLAFLSVFFGGFALFLAAVGLYGVIAYAVRRRTKEIGIRMALGASGTNVGWLVFGETLRLVALGVLFGLPCSLVAARFVGNFLYGLSANNLAIVVTSIGCLMLTAAIAVYVPARRAIRVDPMVALRYE